MPKKAEYEIVWSQKKSRYEVLHGLLSFDLADTNSLHYWLERSNTFHFCSLTGHTLTLRMEQKKRGNGYWYAYKRVGGKVQKKYLGDVTKVDFALLENIARSFVEPVPPPQSPPKQQTPPPRKPTLVFKKTLASALEIYGFPSIPDRRALISRYRELSKQHHPDVGGIHEDMVAVNQAYDYLKRFL
jgi:hypothetical protein